MMKAYINHGRWIAHCPVRQCNGAEIAPPGTPVIRCLSCGTLTHVTHPRNWPEIEAALQMRPIENRNWYPWERVSDLLCENRTHGMVI
jgi:hypothetical protein